MCPGIVSTIVMHHFNVRASKNLHPIIITRQKAERVSGAYHHRAFRMHPSLIKGGADSP